MWTIYNIHRNLYWNEQRHCWCPLEEASRYSSEERDHMPLRSLSHQWRFIRPAPTPPPRPAMQLA